MEELLRYFIKETNEKLSKLEKAQSRTNDRLDDLHSLKVGMIVSARWVSLIVSSVCGLLTMLVTLWAGGKFGG